MGGVLLAGIVPRKNARLHPHFVRLVPNYVNQLTGDAGGSPTFSVVDRNDAIAIGPEVNVEVCHWNRFL